MLPHPLHGIGLRRVAREVVQPDLPRNRSQVGFHSRALVGPRLVVDHVDYSVMSQLPAEGLQVGDKQLRVPPQVNGRNEEIGTFLVVK
ncbi:MAG: hypothetical protein NZ899_11065 [Thermoguttaceae bacterium]|nr:hypothetical protein [Thermoguttaceae bacterium]MDW8079136.1 hypothetical protein [Thermoguttaceae bacterium]